MRFHLERPTRLCRASRRGLGAAGGAGRSAGADAPARCAGAAARRRSRRRSRREAAAFRDGLRAAARGAAGRRARRRSTASTPRAAMRPSGPSPAAPRAAELVAALDAAPAQALPRGALRRRRRSPRLFGRGRRRAAPQREVAATRAYLALRRATSPAGIVDPVAVDPEYIARKPGRAARRRRSSPRSTTAPVAEVLRGLRARRSRLPPADRREGAARGARPDRAPGGRRSPTAPTLHPGDADPRVAELRGPAGAARLSRADGRGRRHRVRRRAAGRRSRRFQRDYGLNDDGVVGAMTLAAINAPVETRLAQVAVNLERHALDERATSGRATSASTSPTSPSRLIEDGKTDLGVEGRGRQDPRHRDAGVRRRGAAPWWSTRPGTSRTRSRSATTCRSCRRTRWC